MDLVSYAPSEEAVVETENFTVPKSLPSNLGSFLSAAAGGEAETRGTKSVRVPQQNGKRTILKHDRPKSSEKLSLCGSMEYKRSGGDSASKKDIESSRSVELRHPINHSTTSSSNKNSCDMLPAQTTGILAAVQSLAMKGSTDFQRSSNENGGGNDLLKERKSVTARKRSTSFGTPIKDKDQVKMKMSLGKMEEPKPVNSENKHDKDSMWEKSGDILGDDKDEGMPPSPLRQNIANAVSSHDLSQLEDFIDDQFETRNWWTRLKNPIQV
ncbi:MAG: hypothetical protein SGCHY_001725 [Lobulomycetales sp.]